MTKNTVKPTPSFWVICVIALIWNLIGVLSYLGEAYITDEKLTQLTEAQQEIINNRPSWATIAFAIAVFGGLLGSLALLFKMKISYLLFIISFFGVIIHLAYKVFITKMFQNNEIDHFFSTIVVVGISFYMITYAKKCKKNNLIS